MAEIISGREAIDRMGHSAQQRNNNERREAELNCIGRGHHVGWKIATFCSYTRINMALINERVHKRLTKIAMY